MVGLLPRRDRRQHGSRGRKSRPFLTSLARWSREEERRGGRGRGARRGAERGLDRSDRRVGGAPRLLLLLVPRPASSTERALRQERGLVREARRDRQGGRKGPQEGSHQQQLSDASVDGQLGEVPSQRGEALMLALNLTFVVVVVVVPRPLRKRFQRPHGAKALERGLDGPCRRGLEHARQKRRRGPEAEEVDLEHELLERDADHLGGLEGAEDAAAAGDGGAAFAVSTAVSTATAVSSTETSPRVERKAHPWPRPPCPALALQRRGPGDKVLDQQAHPSRRVVAPLLELAAVDDEADVVDRDRGLGDVGGDDALAHAWRRALEGPALVGGRDGRVQGQDPAPAPARGLGRGEPGADRCDLRRSGQEDEHGASGADGSFGRRRG